MQESEEASNELSPVWLLRTEKPQHRVNVPPFFLDKYPVTQQQYKAVIKKILFVSKVQVVLGAAFLGIVAVAFASDRMRTNAAMISAFV